MTKGQVAQLGGLALLCVALTQRDAGVLCGVCELLSGFVEPPAVGV